MSDHKPSAALLAALKAAGWTLTAVPWPGNQVWSHPLSGRELPTPECMRGTPAWPFDTYSKLRQVTFNHDGARISAVFLRECAAPWVVATVRKVSFKRAVEYIGQEWE